MMLRAMATATVSAFWSPLSFEKFAASLTTGDVTVEVMVEAPLASMSMSPAVAVVDPPVIRASASVATSLRVMDAATLVPEEKRPVSELLMLAVIVEPSIA